ncbi:MAG: alanine/glycine:cation symporter family protein [Planctomycetota bacterium]|jgi:Na+/alanine symporter
MESIANALQVIANYIFGLPLVVLIMSVGCFYTGRLLFPQVRRIPHSIAITMGKYSKDEDPGDVTHFQALCAALSATVGVGNIAGVATAIHAGGPGALFWMWMSGFLGMAIKYSECTLAQRYRVHHQDGTVSGGPMYYIERGLGPRFRWLAIVFASAGLLATLGGGNMVQSNSLAIAFIDQFALVKFHPDTPLSTLNDGNGIENGDEAGLQVNLRDGDLFVVNVAGAETVQHLLNSINNNPSNQGRLTASISLDDNRLVLTDNTHGDNKFSLQSDNGGDILSELGFLKKDGVLNRVAPHEITTVVPYKWMWRAVIGLIISGVVGAVIIGGIRRIGKVASRLVPFMSGIYTAGALAIIFWNIFDVPHAFYLIFYHAFNPTAAAGGFAGATVLYTVNWGIRRAVFSNEAGLGSAAIAHAAARTKEPVREGLVALLEPMVDTLILCTLTGLVIIVTGQWATAANSSVLTKNAFSAGLPYVGGYVVTASLILFAVSTAISWSYYGDRCAQYLFGPAALFPYRCVYLLFLFLGAMTQLRFVWGFSDIANGMMAFPNLIAIIALSPVVVYLTKDYFSRHHKRVGR